MINETDKPRISILMAVYNDEKFLPEAIDSVIKQTFSQWQLICINDGSTDRSLDILHQYQQKDARVIVIDSPHKGTPAAARNVGLAIVSGHYIAMLDSDDKIEPAYLEKLIARQNETQTDVVVSAINYWEYENNTIVRSKVGINGDKSRIITGKEAFRLSLDWSIGGTGLFLTDMLKKNGFFEIGMHGCEYTTRLMFAEANKVAFSDAIYFYRNNLNSITKKFSVKHFSIVIAEAMLLTLIRKKNFDSDFYNDFKESVVLSLLGNYVKFLKRLKSLTTEERKIALCYLWTATKYVAKEFFFPPFSIKSPFRFMHKLLKKIKQLNLQ